MPFITEELIRKRSEHNEGILPDLEEIALHQEELESMENIGKLAKNLKILLLQNNIIREISGVSRLKNLKYLNLAINNIKEIKNLASCEKLEKLDLTLNFIPSCFLYTSLIELQPLEHLRELYLMGNPCDQDPDYRLLVIFMLSQLKCLDGNDIKASERLEAEQKAFIIQKRYKEMNFDLNEESSDDERKHTRKTRDSIAKETNKQKILKEVRERERLGIKRRGDDPVQDAIDDEKKVRSLRIYNDQGEVRSCNQGLYKFSLLDEKEFTELSIDLPKYLPTDLIDVEVRPNYIRIMIKDKLFQVPVEPINHLNALVTRSKASGVLNIKSPKLV